jgi:hypothetical protein
MSLDDAWKNGVIDGYQSIRPGAIPTIPSRPATIPANLGTGAAAEKWMYEQGYAIGRKKAGK